MPITVEELVKLIDHTRLKPETKRVKIQELCEEAKAYGLIDHVIVNRDDFDKLEKTEN